MESPQWELRIGGGLRIARRWRLLRMAKSPLWSRLCTVARRTAVGRQIEVEAVEVEVEARTVSAVGTAALPAGITAATEGSTTATAPLIVIGGRGRTKRRRTGRGKATASTSLVAAAWIRGTESDGRTEGTHIRGWCGTVSRGILVRMHHQAAEVRGAVSGRNEGVPALNCCACMDHVKRLK